MNEHQLFNNINKMYPLINKTEKTIIPMISLPAYFDGKNICLEKPFDISPNTKLIITIIQELKANKDQEEWFNLSEHRLMNAYGENEPEYSSNLLKEVNPDYEGR